MAVGKEAPIPNVCVTAAACREALAASVAELTETIASLPATTVKRRLRDAAEIIVPSLEHGAAAAANGFPCETKSEGLSKKI